MSAGIQWANLWKAFTDVRRERIPLVVWELFLWLLVGGGTFGGTLLFWWDTSLSLWHVGRLLFPWALAGGIAGGIAAFVCHELFFMPYCERVIGLRECDEGDTFGVNPSYTAPLERWGGPVA